ncbi:MAG: hypothetical protein ABJE00_16805 [Erythrobacter sp.]
MKIKGFVSIVLFVLGLGSVGICMFVLMIQAGSNSVTSVFAINGNISSEEYDRIARGLEAELQATCLRPSENGKCSFLALGDADTYQARVEFKDRGGESIYIVQSLPRYPFLLGSFAVEKDHKTAEKIILATLQERAVRADRRVRNMGREERISLP